MWYDKPTPLGHQLAANRQRRRREQYLTALPYDLRPTLSAAPFITSPALEELAHAWAGAIDDRTGTASDEYTRQRFAWSEKLFADDRRV